MIAYLLIIVVAFAVIAASLTQLVGEYLFTQRVREEERVTTDLAWQLGEMMTNHDAEGMYATSLSVSAEYGARVLVLDQYGAVQVDSDSAMNGRVFAVAEVAGVLSGADADYGYYRAAGSGGDFLSSAYMLANEAVTGVYTAAIRAEENTIGVIVFISVAEDIYKSLNTITRQIVLTLVAVAAVICVLSVAIVKLFMRPIGELNRGLKQMGKGDLTARVRVRGKNEFAELADAFNLMCQRLETLDKSRNQFVSNASHELKTPLSTMKILIETLMYQDEGASGMQKEFLSDIDKEIDRLSSIISDLLTLVNIDSGEMKLRVTDVSLKDIVNDTIHRLAPLARERGIELEGFARESTDMRGDPMKLTQVVYNLVDNAIKYTPRGGTVRVELTKAGKRATIRVIDNGIGIPAEDQLHIFDRFYRVDKARSRETGGTGLGLSIVKQIVLLHDGDIRVSSVEDEGTTFTVELPLAQAEKGGGARA